MMVIHGGRPLGCQSLGDTWGLRRHRNGKWGWIQAPTKETSAKPSVRFQHEAAFIGTLMVVQGGRAETLEEGLQLEVYDTDTSLWKKFDSISRFRHSSWIHGQSMYVYGGFD
jgi:protein phosphatase